MTVDMSDSSDAMDNAQHENTYNMFITLLKYGAGAVLLVLLLMAIFLV